MQKPKVAQKPKKDVSQNVRFVKNSNSVIKDHHTGLEWIVGEDNDITWDDADAWVKNLNATSFAGGNWKLPTILQLREIYKEGSGKYNLDLAFGSFSASYLDVWSDELVDENGKSCGKLTYSPCAHFFLFYNGYDGWLHRCLDYGMCVFFGSRWIDD